jgi:hypothetical protein
MRRAVVRRIARTADISRRLVSRFTRCNAVTMGGDRLQ